jgi:N-acetylneuraminic acid mutarotase
VLIATATCTGGQRPVSGELEQALDHPALRVGRRDGAQPARPGRLAFNERSFRFGESAPEEPAVGSISAESGELRIQRRDADVGFSIARAAEPLGLGPGVQRGDAVVFATPSGDAAVVLTPLGDGVKEDIVLVRSRGDRLAPSWDLRLDEGLEARLSPDGEVGIYGTELALLPRLQIADDQSRAVIEQMRAHGARDRLLYRIPAPLVRQAAGAARRDIARYELSGARLTLRVSGLAALSYPITIDPTVLVATTADFGLGGNAEDNVNIAGNKVARSRTQFGVGPWLSPAFTFSQTVSGACAVTNNGLLYFAGGTLGGSPSKGVIGIQINADGSLNAASAKQVGTLPAARTQHACVAYNGYLYVIGGVTTVEVADIQFARFQADGTLGAFTQAGVLPATRQQAAAAAFGGNLYVVTGQSAGADLATTVTATFAPDGTLTNIVAASFSVPSRRGAGMAVRGGSLYLTGGVSGPTGYLNDSWFLNPAQGLWQPGPAFTGARAYHGSVISNGYLYLIGGSVGGTAATDVQGAAISAAGSLEIFQQTTPLPAPRASFGAVASNDRLFLVGGVDASGVAQADLISAAIGAFGPLAGWATTLSTPSGAPPRTGAAAVAYKGSIFVTGGNTAAAGLTPAVSNTILIGAVQNNAITSWTTSTTTLPTVRMWHAAMIYNDYLYIIGGTQDGTKPEIGIDAAPISADGTAVGAFTSGGASLPTARFGHQALQYNGTLYVIGGNNGTTNLSDVQGAPFQTPAFNATNPLTTVGPFAQKGTLTGGRARSLRIRLHADGLGDGPRSSHQQSLLDQRLGGGPQQQPAHRQRLRLLDGRAGPAAGGGAGAALPPAAAPAHRHPGRARAALRRGRRARAGGGKGAAGEAQGQLC